MKRTSTGHIQETPTSYSKLNLHQACPHVQVQRIYTAGSLNRWAAVQVKIKLANLTALPL